MSAWRQTPTGKQPTDQRMLDIVAEIRAGRRFKEIAARFGVSVSRISHIRRQAEIKRRIQPAASN